MILLASVTFGITLFSFVNESTRYEFNAFGITEISVETGRSTGHQSMLIYVGLIALILLCFLCIMSYKNLAKQFRLGRTIFFIYFVAVVAMVLLSMYGDGFVEAENLRREMGPGFILVIIGFPFTFLANVGIKRDKRLLESLDRLR